MSCSYFLPDKNRNCLNTAVQGGRCRKHLGLKSPRRSPVRNPVQRRIQSPVYYQEPERHVTFNDEIDYEKILDIVDEQLSPKISKLQKDFNSVEERIVKVEGTTSLVKRDVDQYTGRIDKLETKTEYLSTQINEIKLTIKILESDIKRLEHGTSIQAVLQNEVNNMKHEVTNLNTNLGREITNKSENISGRLTDTNRLTDTRVTDSGRTTDASRQTDNNRFTDRINQIQNVLGMPGAFFGPGQSASKPPPAQQPSMLNFNPLGSGPLAGSLSKPTTMAAGIPANVTFAQDKYVVGVPDIDVSSFLSEQSKWIYEGFQKIDGLGHLKKESVNTLATWLISFITNYTNKYTNPLINGVGYQLYTQHVTTDNTLEKLFENSHKKYDDLVKVLSELKSLDPSDRAKLTDLVKNTTVTAKKLSDSAEKLKRIESEELKKIKKDQISDDSDLFEEEIKAQGGNKPPPVSKKQVKPPVAGSLNNQAGIKIP